jgi:ferredoxin
MVEAEIRFEREGLDGIIPVGSYIGDALRRFGVKSYDRCSAEHDCVVEVRSGEELLSPMTTAESEYFKEEGRGPGERLACHAKIEKAGEIVVMTKERKKAEEPKADEAGAEDYRKQFTEMPLEQKITELVKLEAIALGETFSFILNSPFTVFEKVGDVMAEFGMKLEDKDRKSKRPPEHAAAGDENAKKENGDRTTGSKKKKA